MKTIGMIGGLAWPSSAQYYELINQNIQGMLGASHSARILLYSFDFHDVDVLQHQGLWGEAASLMIAAARILEQGGADLLLICSNTMHRVADEVQESCRIPLLHIADAVAGHAHQAGIATVGLLGTKFTMEEGFYKNRLARHGLATLIPEPEDRDRLHRIIYDELVRGIVTDSSRDALRKMVVSLEQKGAEGIILGCTEIMLLTKKLPARTPILDSTALHAQAAASHALSTE